MEPRTLDLAAYPRRAHFDYFRQMANPYVSVTAPCDITALRRLTQERGLPFFLTVLHCAINAANAVPELRQRIRGEGIVEYDRCLSSHTVALPDGTYCYCTLDCAQPLGAFLPAAQAETARVKAALAGRRSRPGRAVLRLEPAVADILGYFPADAHSGGQQSPHHLRQIHAGGGPGAAAGESDRKPRAGGRPASCRLL